jgi:hypothetical protein
MRVTRSCLIVCTLLGSSCNQHLVLPGGTNWDEKSGVFRWKLGEVTLPPGFTYQVDPSDTFEGHFTSRDGKPVIRLDNGGYAGAYAERKDALFFEERLVDGVRVWTARRKWGVAGTKTLMAVTFPDNGCANFYLESSNAEDAAIIDALARSFRPKGQDKPSSRCGR